MNHSALARYMRPNVEKTTGEKVSVEAVTMALNRLGKSLAGAQERINLLQYLGDVSVQTGLTTVVIETQGTNVQTLQARRHGEFFVMSQGIWHATIITKTAMLERLDLSPEHIVVRDDNLTGLTVKLEAGNIEVPGVCALILQVLANHAINLREVLSTHDELTMVLREEYAQRALNAILDLKAQGRFDQDEKNK